MRTTEAKRLKSLLNVPNAISAGRILLAPLVAWAILERLSGVALALFAAAAATDVFDGFFARASGSTTKTGQYLDPIADKVLLSAVYLALGFSSSVPWWFVGIVFGRDTALLCASAIAMRYSHYDDYTPTVWGKLSTLLQIAAAVCAIWSAASPLSHAMVYVSAGATLWSAMHYTWRGVSFFYRRGRG